MSLVTYQHQQVTGTTGYQVGQQNGAGEMEGETVETRDHADSHDQQQQGVCINPREPRALSEGLESAGESS